MEKGTVDMVESDDASEQNDARSARDAVLVAALAAGASYRDAATQARVAPRTVARRMADPAFEARVKQARRDHVAAITGLLLDGGSDAVAVLREVLVNAERPADRLRAASILLRESQRFQHHQDLEERVVELERRLAGADVGA